VVGDHGLGVLVAHDGDLLGTRLARDQVVLTHDVAHQVHRETEATSGSSQRVTIAWTRRPPLSTPAVAGTRVRHHRGAVQAGMRRNGEA